MPKKCLIYCVIIFFANSASGQNASFFGKVLDKGGKHEPIPFVKIVTKKVKITSLADIDGRWQLNDVSKQDTILFSCLGYKTVSVPVTKLVFGNDNVIYMSEQTDKLQEVVVLQEKNPAERIIMGVLRNKRKNDWRRIHAFTYNSYNHYAITEVDGDSTGLKEKIKNPELKLKSSRDSVSLDSFFKKQYAFLGESIEETKYKAPGDLRKTVIATKTSGVKDPIASQFISQFQDFDIYKDMIEVFGKTYISPITNRAIKNYLFVLKDTLWPGNGDTVFVISYQPRSGKLFDGFKGLIYVNTKKFAVQNIVANPFGSDQDFSLRIEQQFDWVDSSHWFPVKLNSLLKFYDIKNSKQKIAGVGKSYITNINLHPILKQKDLGSIAFEVDPNAVNKDSTYWQKNRTVPLTRKDSMTYHVIDSFGKAENLDLKLKVLESYMAGRIRIWDFDLDVNKIYKYNAFETSRLGIGGYTNDRLSSYYSLGGYWGYGFKDKATKYGGSLDLIPFKNSFFRIGGSYSNDLAEFGSVSFLLDKPLILNANYRDLNVSDFVTNQSKSAYIRWRMLGYLQTQVAFNNINSNLHDGYAYISPDNISHNTFTRSEAIVAFRYAYKEKLIKMPGFTTEQPTDFPVLLLQYTRNLKGIMGGQYTYNKIDVKIDKSFTIKLAGKSSFQIKAGKTIGETPLFVNYNGIGNLSNLYLLPLSSNNAFETMRMNEFFSSQYVYLFYKHSFQNLLYKSKLFTPVVNFVQNMGIGSLSHPSENIGLTYKTMEKGYYESGVTIETKLKNSFYNIGVGFFYRYGPYAFAKPGDNLAIKLTLTLAYF